MTTEQQIEAAANEEMGVVKSVGMATDENGREVLRAIVDFHNGNAPAITPAVIWNCVPVKIIECKAAAPSLTVGERVPSKEGA